jgi:hypothetical protein
MDAKLYAKVAKGNLLIFYSVYLTDFFAFIAVLPLRPLRLKNPGEFLVSWCLGGRKRHFFAEIILVNSWCLGALVAKKDFSE